MCRLYRILRKCNCAAEQCHWRKCENPECNARGQPAQRDEISIPVTHSCIHCIPHIQRLASPFPTPSSAPTAQATLSPADKIWSRCPLLFTGNSGNSQYWNGGGMRIRDSIWSFDGRLGDRDLAWLLTACEILEKDLMELRVGFWRSYPPWKAEFFVYIQGTAERGLVDAREDEILEEEARLAAPDIVKKLLLAQISLSTLKEDEKSCTICSETLGETVHDISENPVKLDCGHMFGDVCLLRWIGDQNKATCPMCRREYLKTAWEFPESLVGEDLWWMRALRQEEMGLREGLHEALPQIP